MSEIRVRAARPGDARAIARLDIETWRSTYAGMLSPAYLIGLSERRREIGWRNVILREPRDVRVALDVESTLLGFGSCGPSRGDRRFLGEVFTLYVAPDWQNRGIGRSLLIALFHRLVAVERPSALVWVLRDNPGRFFYERLGGRQIGRKFFNVAGETVEASAYGWPDLRGFLAAAAKGGRGGES